MLNYVHLIPSSLLSSAVWFVTFLFTFFLKQVLKTVHGENKMKQRTCYLQQAWGVERIIPLG